MFHSCQTRLQRHSDHASAYACMLFASMVFLAIIVNFDGGEQRLQTRRSLLTTTTSEGLSQVTVYAYAAAHGYDTPRTESCHPKSAWFWPCSAKIQDSEWTWIIKPHTALGIDLPHPAEWRGRSALRSGGEAKPRTDVWYSVSLANGAGTEGGVIAFRHKKGFTADVLERLKPVSSPCDGVQLDRLLLWSVVREELPAAMQSLPDCAPLSAEKIDKLTDGDNMRAGVAIFQTDNARNLLMSSSASTMGYLARSSYAALLENDVFSSNFHPLVVTAVVTSTVDTLLRRLLRSLQEKSPQQKVLVYSMGLSAADVERISSHPSVFEVRESYSRQPAALKQLFEQEIELVMWLDPSIELQESSLWAFANAASLRGWVGVQIDASENVDSNRWKQVSTLSAAQKHVLQQQTTVPYCDTRAMAFHTRNDAAIALFDAWHACATTLDCISPTTHEEKHDAIVLSLLAHLQGLRCKGSGLSSYGLMMAD